MKAVVLILLFGLASVGETVAQALPEHASAQGTRQDTLHLSLASKYPSLWTHRDYNRWRVECGTEPLPETTFLKVVGLDDQIAAARQRQKNFRRLQRGARFVTMAGLFLMGGALLNDNDRDLGLYGSAGAGLAVVGAGSMMLGIHHFRKQGLSPAEAQALVDQYNRAVIQDFD